MTKIPKAPRLPSTIPPPNEDVPTLIRDLKAFTRACFEDLRTQLVRIEDKLRRHDERLTKAEARLEEVRLKFKRLEKAIASRRRPKTSRERARLPERPSPERLRD